jgi:hypothetical protein
MKCPQLTLVVTLALLAAPLAAEAQQQAAKLSRVGVLMNLYAPDAPPPQALRVAALATILPHELDREGLRL